MSLKTKRSNFPSDFIFGTATAAYQIEGNQFGKCGLSHWDSFAATPGNVVNAENGAKACDHYHRYNEDFDLVRDGGFDAYRFSTSWARVMPDGATVNEEGLDFYDRLVDAMMARDLKPYLTLYHWDLPSPLADIGGWVNREIPLRFVDHSEAVIRRIGDRIAAVSTINEPWCVSWLSHFMGHHAPGLRDVRAAARAMHHVLLAHGQSMAAMRAMGQRNLGIVLNLTDAHPASDKPEDIKAAKTLDGIFNRWFLDGIFCGEYPEDVLEGLGAHMTTGYQDDMATISAPMDWLGVNYYSRAIMAYDAAAPWPHAEGVDGPLPKTQMGWEIYPDGLMNLLERIDLDYSKLPLFITENGMAWDDKVENGAVYDPERIAYLDAHIDVVRQAIDRGINMKGYFYWSLLDNFEWAFGYEKRFGLTHVDFDTMKRTPKASYYALRAALAT